MVGMAGATFAMYRRKLVVVAIDIIVLFIMYIDMVTSLLVSVVTVTNLAGVVFQKVYINDQDAARSCARRFEEENADLIRNLDWFITVRDY